MAKKDKKKKRDQEKYPELNESVNLKLRRDYTDSRHYINGIKEKGVQLIPALDDDNKAYLNQFNKEYYNASFKPEDADKRLMEAQVDDSTIQDIKAQIRAIKVLRKRIFDKSPNTTTEADREQAQIYNDQIEGMEEFLNVVHPRRACEHANNARNRCFVNRNKASNEVDLVSWETLKEDTLKVGGSDDYYDYIIDKLEEDD